VAQELSSKLRADVGVTEKQVQLTMGPEGAVKFKLTVSIPTGKTRRMPAIVKNDLCWGRVPDSVIREASSRGYILVEFDRTEIAPDGPGRTAAIYAAYPDCDAGVEAMWAWAYHRVVDYLLKQDFVDSSRIAITGHSRGGKAALLAGALDERIALVAPNASGAGGASAYRVLHPKGESLKAVTTNFPFWFGPGFSAFQGKETRLPFDQHALRALVAPRAMLSTEGTGDLWANPSGNQQAHLAAREVFVFLSAPDKIGIHYRPGGHDQGPEDWTALLDFADQQFFGKSVTRKFDQLPEPDAPKAFSWSAPPAAK
jgi:dienelactone hydrolase